ncbi:hypothetical protein [Actinokineospora sp.]|uniref:hypothetical protein n=1 Tax=Actinokineospora sp. TaxID=1872133 RepID=UPI003D6AFA29
MELRFGKAFPVALIVERVAKIDTRHRYEAGAEAWLAKDKVAKLRGNGEADPTLIT